MNDHLIYQSEIEYWKDVYKNKIRFASKNNSLTIPWDIKDADPNLKKILEDIDFNRGDLLELGCGTGNDSKYFHKNGFNVTAIDVSEEAIETARIDNDINFIVADFFNMVMTDQYDIVYDRGFAHNYRNKLLAIFEKVSYLLKNKGKYLIISGNPNQPHIETCTPPPLFLGEIEHYSAKWFKIVLVKEIVFKTDKDYNDCLGYFFVLEKR